MPRDPDAFAGLDEPTSEVDLRAIGAALKRRRRVYLLPTILVFLGVAAYVNVATPRYTAQTQILLENQETYFTRPDRAGNAAEASGQLDETAVASQVQLIGSADIARRAIKALHLEGNPEFDPLAGGMNPVARVLVLLGVLGRGMGWVGGSPMTGVTFWAVPSGADVGMDGASGWGLDPDAGSEPVGYGAEPDVCAHPSRHARTRQGDVRRRPA